MLLPLRYRDIKAWFREFVIIAFFSRRSGREKANTCLGIGHLVWILRFRGSEEGKILVLVFLEDLMDSKTGGKESLSLL